MSLRRLIDFRYCLQCGWYLRWQAVIFWLMSHNSWLIVQMLCDWHWVNTCAGGAARIRETVSPSVYPFMIVKDVHLSVDQIQDCTDSEPDSRSLLVLYWHWSALWCFSYDKAHNLLRWVVVWKNISIACGLTLHSHLLILNIMNQCALLREHYS